ncbi:hypothetical protein Ddc_12178 [Ditylenchus destructor]|nr:hypothetical protein Ddc_12178 [Ditylenchus destructor]
MGATLSQATYPPFIFSLIVGIPSLILYILEWPATYYAAWSATLFAISCGILNFLIIFLYHQARAAQTASSGTARLAEQQVESRLTIYAIVTFIAQLFMAIYYVLGYIASWMIPDPIANANLFLTLANQNCWVYDVSNIVLPAWFLLWASSQLRELIFSLLLPRSWETQTALFTERRTVAVIKLSRIAGGSLS